MLIEYTEMSIVDLLDDLNYDSIEKSKSSMRERSTVESKNMVTRSEVVLDHLPHMLLHDRFGLGSKPQEIICQIDAVIDLPIHDDDFGGILAGLDNLVLLRSGTTIRV
jgi:hypothetical protein